MSYLPSTIQNTKSAISDEPITICRIIRRMRGGSQSLLVLGADNRHYVAKFLGNPQGGRSLVNELIAYQLIRQLDVLTPPLALLHLPDNLAEHDELYFVMGDKRVRPEGRLHLGSQVPVNPDKIAIFDFLPDSLLSRISNLSEFGTMFVLDKWLHQADSRQAVFVRDKTSRVTSYLAYFVDHGRCFEGKNWELRDIPRQGLAAQTNIYHQIHMRDLIQVALSKVEGISEEAIMATAMIIPSAWLQRGDRESLETLLERLRDRQLTLPLLIARHLDYLRF